MFRLLATTKCKRQQIALLIISFFAYVYGIRNEGNNMLLQQQQQQPSTIENSNYQSPLTDIKKPTTSSNFRPSPIIDFTPADAAVPQNFKPSYLEPQHNIANDIAIYSNNNSLKKQEIPNVNRRYTFETAASTIYGNTIAGEKQFSFPNEQQQQQHIPQHLTDKPIYIYRDPYTNENYHYTPTETNLPPTTTAAATFSHNNYYNNNNNNGYKQQDDDNNQEYLVQSSMIVGTHQQPQQQHSQQQPNPFRPYMSLSDDKDVYLKRPGFVYDEKLGYQHPNTVNSVIDKKSEETQTLKANKISYDSHDYPPPSYYQQQTSNFLPTPVPSTPKPTAPPTSPPRPEYSPPVPTQSTIFTRPPQHQQQYLQSSQPSSLSNYANNIDNYLWNKQQPNEDYYRREVPPPSYFQQYQQQQQRPQYDSRPPYEYDTRPQSLPPPSYYQQQPQYVSRPPPSSASYNPLQYPQYETNRPPPPPPPPGRPSYNNYYDYQIGEIPPPSEHPQQQFNYPYPRPPPSQYPYQGPYRPPPPPQHQQQSGFATLAQYAPQFTSLLLSGVTGGAGGGSNSPLGSIIGALAGGQQSTSPSSSTYNRRPVNSQLIKALENIARNDDLQCVPKVLCQMIASQTQRGQLPAFITSPAITNFLAGFPASSPALIYGRAALLGLSGGEKSCHQTYVKCPKDEYEIIYYLNNHRGGFFKFFSEPDEQQQTVNHDSTQQGATSLFSILSALAGTPQVTTTTPRPTPKPQAPVTDITSGIGNFFTQLLSDYVGSATVEYQRRFKRRTKRSLNDKIKFEDDESQETNKDRIKFEDESREHHDDVLKFKDEDYDTSKDYNDYNHQQQDTDEDFHDEEDDEDTHKGVEFKDEDDEQDYLNDTHGRIVHKSGGREKRVKFFPEIRETSDEIDKEEEIKKIIKKFNEFNKVRKLKFPTNTDERLYVDAAEQGVRKGKELNEDLAYENLKYGHNFNNYIENSYEDFQKDSKKIKFINDSQNRDTQDQAQLSLYSNYLQKPKDSKVVFPEREGKILNRPYYAASYLQDYLQQQHLEEDTKPSAQDDKFVVSNSQRPLRYTEFPASASSANIYNTQINSLHSQNSFTSNAAVNNNIYVSAPPPPDSDNSNHFLPTPIPFDNDYTAANSIYTNSDFNNDNQYNYNSLKPSNYYTKPQRYPSSSFSSSYTPTSYPSFPWTFLSNSGGSSSNKFYKPHRYNTPSVSSNSQVNYNRYHSSLYTTTRGPYVSVTTTRKSGDDKNIYVTNSRGVTEYYITPDGRKVYL